MRYVQKKSRPGPLELDIRGSGHREGWYKNAPPHQVETILTPTENKAFSQVEELDQLVASIEGQLTRIKVRMRTLEGALIDSLGKGRSR